MKVHATFSASHFPLSTDTSPISIQEQNMSTITLIQSCSFFRTWTGYHEAKQTPLGPWLPKCAAQLRLRRMVHATFPLFHESHTERKQDMNAALPSSKCMCGRWECPTRNDNLHQGWFIEVPPFGPWYEATGRRETSSRILDSRRGKNRAGTVLKYRP